MEIKKDTIIKVNHSRKGVFYAVAERDFDTEKEDFYPVKVAKTQMDSVKGMDVEWEIGESIPCRGEFCKIELLT